MPRAVTKTGEIRLLLELVDRSYDRRSWHGPNLRGSLRGIGLSTASFRPAPGRHNIGEHLVHAAYWKYTVRRRLLGEKRGSFPEKGSNWFSRPTTPTQDAWEADLRLLQQCHRTMRDAIAAVPEARLRMRLPGGSVSYFDLIAGIAAHDVYHAGQIQLLKRLASGGGE